MALPRARIAKALRIRLRSTWIWLYLCRAKAPAAAPWCVNASVTACGAMAHIHHSAFVHRAIESSTGQLQ